MTTNTNKSIVPIAIFWEAALNYFKCKPEDIETHITTKNKEAVVIYNGGFYRISTYEKLWEDIELQLTGKEAVHHINFFCWIEATKNTVRLGRFLGKLIRTLEDTEQAKMLLLAIQLGSYTEDVEVVFWNVLSRIDKEGNLLRKAMTAVGQVYDGQGLIEDLLQLQIIHGKEVYNRIVGGIFEQVTVEDTKGSDIEFLLYSIEGYFIEYALL